MFDYVYKTKKPYSTKDTNHGGSNNHNLPPSAADQPGPSSATDNQPSMRPRLEATSDSSVMDDTTGKRHLLPNILKFGHLYRQDTYHRTKVPQETLAQDRSYGVADRSLTITDGSSILKELMEQAPRSTQ